ncbi:MAG: hypothetical protein ACREC8_12725 [Limisphaerales bacterium]
MQPTNVTYYAGISDTFSITASGSPPLAYQWYQDGALIADATNQNYKFAVLLGTNTYYCAVTNNYSAVIPITSSTGTVVGIAAPETINASDFSYKMKIQFSGYNRSEILQDFPALVRLGTNVPGFSYSQVASPTGRDLRFADSSGTVSLPYEINQ